MFENVNEYIESFPEETQNVLHKIRSVIITTIPLCQEKISYKMPSYFHRGVLVYFAAYKNHIGFYPTGSAIIHFEKKIKNYKTSKGTIQFTYDNVPYELIKEIVEFRVLENEKKYELKKTKK